MHYTCTRTHYDTHTQHTHTQHSNFYILKFPMNANSDTFNYADS